MRTEAPILRRCCFCVPLRYGLLLWGYFKLVVTLVLLLYLFIVLYVTIIYLSICKYYVNIYVVIYATALLMLTGDFILHIIFVVGAHSKDIKLLNVYYIYSIILAVISFLVLVTCTGIMMNRIFIESNSPLNVKVFSELSSLFVNSLLQVYLILLVKSEIVKLKNSMSFRFVNNAVEAECTLVIEDTSTEKPPDANIDIEVDDDCTLKISNMIKKDMCS